MHSKIALGLLIAFAVGGPAFSKEFSLTTEQSEALFDQGSRGQILALLRSIPWQEADLRSRSALLFTSGESRGAEGQRVLNRIQLFERPGFDIWLMKQRVAGHGFDFRNWNRIAVVVDRRARPHRAFYFQFGQEALGEKGLPRFKAFTAACLSCHSSGPRLIRPEQTPWTRPFSKRDTVVLRKWNWRIEGYREVLDYNPRWRGRSMVEWEGKRDHEPLELNSCTECHFHGSGVRSPLTRQNADSIRYLTLTSNEMPVESHLATAERKELRSWLDQASSR